MSLVRAVAASSEERMTAMDLVDVEDGDEQAVHQVGALATLAQAEPSAPGDHREAVTHEYIQKLPQPQGVGLVVHEGDVVDAEGVLQRCVLVELGQDRLGVVAVLTLMTRRVRACGR